MNVLTRLEVGGLVRRVTAFSKVSHLELMWLAYSIRLTKLRFQEFGHRSER